MNPIIERFWSKVDKNGPVPAHRPELGPCWSWVGSKNTEGYGNFWIGGRCEKAHRFAYKLLVGWFDPKLDVDHLCYNTSCINPDHLEPVTHHENVLRSRPRKVAKRCKRGHDLDDDNVGWHHGRRYCRTCNRAYQRSRYIVAAER
jgi:hypothetical protein